MAVQRGNTGTQSLSKGFAAKGKMFLFTSLTALVITGILLLITAVLLDKLSLSENTVRLLIYGVYIISGFSAGFVAGKWKKERKFLWGLSAGFVWLGIVLIISICINGTNMDTGALFPAIVSMIGGGMLGGMLA